jgi:hypothetical protein
MINYTPNDPLAETSLPTRQQPARPDRSGNRAGFLFISPAPAENTYPPITPEFLFWQSREAALAAVEAWEAIDGPFTQWAPQVANRRKLLLLPNAGNQLNAYYDGSSISFFEHTAGGKTSFSGASTDVVAHETGHGLLDSIRPDLWGSNFPETGAFHEAFGDCIALITAFFDEPTRRKVLQESPDLSVGNFLEATTEDLADGVRRDPDYGPTHSASAPRHALNTFQWSLPTTLPVDGPPPTLISEIHSFGRVFSGCFYDLIRNIFAASATQTQATLLAAVQIAGRVLVAGARQAPEVPRFFQSVGRSMVLADETLNNGANRAAIRAAFTSHNIALGTDAMLAPRAALDGPAPKFTSRGAKGVLSTETIRDIKRRMDIPSATRLAVDVLTIGAQKVAKAMHVREVSLSAMGREFKDVVALVPQEVMVGATARAAALVSAIPEPFTTQDEVNAFVTALLAHGQLDMGTKKSAVRGAIADARKKEAPLPTHGVFTRGNRRVLQRLRFACGPRGGACTE